MKAITIHEPWASLVAIGAKPDETRSWATKYRGPIAIHASKKNPHAILREMPAYRQLYIFDTLYKAFGIKSGAIAKMEENCGKIIATATLTECWQVIERTDTAIILRQSNGIGEDKIPIDAPYLAFGDYSVGRYIWGMADVKQLAEPIPARGQQGLWNWERCI